jgi:hypothetical protein
MKFTAKTKIEVALYMPMFVFVVVGVYAGIMMVQVNRQSDATSVQRQSAQHQLRGKVTSVVTTIFTVGSIFFIKSFL